MLSDHKPIGLSCEQAGASDVEVRGHACVLSAYNLIRKTAKKFQQFSQCPHLFSSQSYTPPSADAAEAGSTTTAAPSSSRSRNTVNALHPPASNDPEKVVLPLAEGVFSRNCGLPLVVVMTKSDCINSVLERELGYEEEQLDFIQMHLRRFCLERGAALFYLSVKEDKNCELFSRYLQHRIYGFPFTAAAYVVEKDSVFVPAGWDNAKKIGILTENLVKIAPDANFYEVVTRPSSPRKSGRDQREAEAVAEDEQVSRHGVVDLVGAGSFGHNLWLLCK